ncbi:MAG: DUF1028 domain-containing protein [Pseudomonadota bacterium]
MPIQISRTAALFWLLLLVSTSASATYSIVACDPQTQSCGVAVATHNLAVGNSVPFAKAGVGAGVSQFETNPLHSEALLTSLSAGDSAQRALDLALEAGKAFGDRAGLDERQVAVVSIRGDSAAFTGESAGPVAGHRQSAYVSVQGNGLASDEVLEAMLQTFEQHRGPLGEGLLTALEAGLAAGGQRIGVMSAALLVATPQGWPVDIDLRVDFATGEAVHQLRRAYNAVKARSLVFQAGRLRARGEVEKAEASVQSALKLAPDWDRIWLNAARFSLAAGDRRGLQERFCRFSELNPSWSALVLEEFESVRCQ